VNSYNAHQVKSLGAMYAGGQGISKDYAEALKWFRLAADQGNARRQYSLGLIYEQGMGVLIDHTRARQWPSGGR
jgi:uncharacterized protein